MIYEDKIANEFELFIENFHPCCTSDEYSLELFKAVLGILKQQKAYFLYWSDKYDEIGKIYMSVRDERDELLNERNVAEWLQKRQKCGYGRDGRASFCSVCDGFGRKSWKYCPHCGARMKGWRSE